MLDYFKTTEISVDMPRRVEDVPAGNNMFIFDEVEVFRMIPDKLYASQIPRNFYWRWSKDPNYRLILSFYCGDGGWNRIEEMTIVLWKYETKRGRGHYYKERRILCKATWKNEVFQDGINTKYFTPGKPLEMGKNPRIGFYTNAELEALSNSKNQCSEQEERTNGDDSLNPEHDSASEATTNDPNAPEPGADAIQPRTALSRLKEASSPQPAESQNPTATETAQGVEPAGAKDNPCGVPCCLMR